MEPGVPIYLDHHATTPCDPRVLEAMAPWWIVQVGNASSVQHSAGRRAHRAVEEARLEVAALIGASPREIVFTSGATEALNMALKGLWLAREPGPWHLVVSSIEHKAVLDVAAWLEAQGAEVSRVGVDGEGRVEPEEVRRALRPSTRAIAVMAANNEIGTLQPIASLATLANEAGAALVVDAVQAVGRTPVDVGSLGVALLALSGHKIYGPQGVGALYVRSRPRVRLEPLLHGGGQERGLRSGTLPVAALVGLGVAARLAREEGARDAEHTRRLASRLRERLTTELDGVELNGSWEERLPNNLNLSLRGVQADELLGALGEVCLSSGSACTSESLEPSHVLRALGLPEARILGSIRIGLGRGTTREEVERAADRLIEVASRLRR